MPGVLEKLKIMAFKELKDLDKALLAQPAGTFTAYFNPESYSVSYGIEYADEKAANATGNQANFKNTVANTYSFELVVDGTGLGGITPANPVILPVKQRVDNFLAVVYDYNGEAHRPHYLKLVWGNLTAKVVLESLDITYNLFAPNGSPLRARLSTSFRDVVSYEMMEAKKRDNSPDLTHTRIIRKGDTLPNLCKQIYGDAGLYQEVAEANELSNFRKLLPGSTIFFPPLKEV